MKHTRILLLVTALLSSAVALWHGAMSAAALAPQAQPSQPPPTLAAAVDREISAIEKQVVEVAEAMPEDKFNFSPESLTFPAPTTRECGRLLCR